MDNYTTKGDGNPHFTDQPRTWVDSMQAFWNKLGAWSQETFGSDQKRGPIGPLKHLQKETQETLDSITDGNAKPCGDLMEFGDMLFLVFDATRRAGYTYEQLVQAVHHKLEINKKRNYPMPSGDEVSEHVRS